ncbi:MAG: hypothetical protein ABIR58_05465 [Gemmatimonadaceae bacterium]
MTTIRRTVRYAVAALAIGASTACSSTGGLGGILGDVLGGGNSQQNQVSGTIQGVDTRSQQISIRQSNGQTVSVGYDNRTQVSYENQNYPVTALEYGDEVTARIRADNNSYYADLVQVNRSVRGSGGTSGGTSGGSGNVQSLQGIVRRVDVANGIFTIDANSNVLLTVSLPYNANRNDVSRFQNLRVNDNVRFYGVFLNNTRVELRQFY